MQTSEGQSQTTGQASSLSDDQALLRQLQTDLSAKRAADRKRKSEENVSLRESLQKLRSKFESARATAASNTSLSATEIALKYQREILHDSLLAASALPRRHKHALAKLQRDGRFKAWSKHCNSVVGRIGTGGFLLAIVGRKGAGKTQIAACAIDAACWAGKSTTYIEANALFMVFRDAFKDGAGEMRCFKKFTKQGLLVIDQLEERKQSEHEDRMLFNIINKRYAEELDTILVSNETTKDFLKSLGRSNASRLTQTGEIMECDWEDFRA